MFYDTLLTQTRQTSQRLVFTSLYLGVGELEERLVAQIPDKVDTSLILDANRGQREPKLTEKYQNVKFLEIPVSKFARMFSKTKYKEMFGVMHVKCYIFDGKVAILSGANLSTSYFTNRQDRYLLIKNTPKFVNFMEKSMLELGNREEMQKFWPAHFLGSDIEGDTMLFPTIQCKKLKVEHDSRVMLMLLEELVKQRGRLVIMSGYLNFTNFVIEILQNAVCEVTVIGASSEANGFYKGEGVSGIVPEMYECIAKDIKKSLPNVEFLEYAREDWTYHQKGVTFLPENLDEPCLTTVGSSNLGWRAYLHDMEAQVVVVSKAREFRAQLEDEIADLEPYIRPLPSNRNPLSKRVLSELCRSYL